MALVSRLRIDSSSISDVCRGVLSLTLLALLFCGQAAAQAKQAAVAATGEIKGMTVDSQRDAAAGAMAQLSSLDGSVRREAPSDEAGAYDFGSLPPGLRYVVTISAPGFSTCKYEGLELAPGETRVLPECMLTINHVDTTIDVTPETAAALQVEEEIHQRVLGVIPNFYTVYDHNPTSLTVRMKFKLAYKVATDPITATGVAFLAGVNQMARTPDFQLGAAGYGQRFGAAAADGVSDIFIGGALLPSLLHQDPRYYYLGGSDKKARFRHAVASPFVCRSDAGARQINFSSLGGDLVSSALSNAYYPDSNRGAGLVFVNFAISTAERVASSLMQEFVIPLFMKRR